METIELSLTERLILANQFEILARLDPNEASNYNELVMITERGYSAEYIRLFEGLDRDGLTAQECIYVTDILDMFWNLQDSYKQLADKGDLKETDVSFRGFDGNNEGKFLGYAKFCLNQGFDGFHRTPDLNSHFPMASRYRKMLTRYESTAIERRRGLSTEEIRSILEL